MTRIKGSCTKDPHAKIQHKWSHRILQRRSCHGDFAQEIFIHRSRKKWSYKNLMQMDLGREICIQRSCPSCPAGSEILHKRSDRDLVQKSQHRDLAQEIRIQKFCTGGPTGCWCRDPHTPISHKCYYQILLRKFLTNSTQTPCTRDPWTGYFFTRNPRGI